MWKKNNTGKKGDVLKRYLGEAREFLGDRVSSVFLFTMIYSGPLWLKSMKLSGPYVQVLCACAESCHLLLVSPCKWKADLVQLLCSRNSLQWCIIIIPEDFMLKLSPVCIFFFQIDFIFWRSCRFTAILSRKDRVPMSSLTSHIQLSALSTPHTRVMHLL